MTLTLLARNPYTGQTGFAIASGSDDCVSGSIEAHADIGAISLQAKGDVSLKARLFSLLAEGHDAPYCLDHLIKTDPKISQRQILILPKTGDSLAYTGHECLKWAGHIQTEHYLLAGNMLQSDLVLPLMEKAFLADRTQMLHRRLFAAIKAGIMAGGDIRGHKSAGITVLGSRPFTVHVQSSVNPLSILEMSISNLFFLI